MAANPDADASVDPDLTGGPSLSMEQVPDIKPLEKSATTNPFATGAFSGKPTLEENTNASDEPPNFPYIPTNVAQQELRTFPYKTANRILDDMRLTPGFLDRRGAADVDSLLNSRPLFYKDALAANYPSIDYAALILNNPVTYAPSVARQDHEKDHVTVSTVRGIIVDRPAASGSRSSPQNRVAGHFKVQILDSSQSRLFTATDKNQYHVVPRELVSVDDLSLLTDSATRSESVLDDAFFKKLNSVSNHVMRVTVYRPEFAAEELLPISDPDHTRRRWLDKIEHDPECGLAPESAPSPVHCFQTLLKVLKGPVLLPEDEVTHTISKKKTNLDAKINTELLFRNLHFTVNEDPDSLVPPNLSLAANQSMRESYIRKATELIYLGKSLKTNGRANDFDVNYSFSNNLSQIHTLLAEVDKHTTLASGWGDVSNRHPAYIALSTYAYFQDELTIRSYEHTVNSDPANKMYYVDSFTQLLSLRSSNGSGRLQSYYNNQYQKGFMYGLADYRAALEALGIVGLSDDVQLDEEAIIEMYKTACQSDAKNYTYFSKQLRIICAIRNSPFIEEFIRTEIVPQSVALAELRIEDVTEDEVVITAYEFRLDEVVQSVNFVSNSPEVVFLQKCLLSIAVARKSYLLMAYLDAHMPELVACPWTLTLEESSQILGVEETTSDFDVILKFQTELMQSTYGDRTDIRVLRAALEIIAKHTQSEILMSFLKNGRIDESLLPPENWPTGLDNIGNTCYLNSLLQYYFSIKPLRDVILNFDEKNVDLSKYPSRKIGGRLVEKAENGRSIQFIYRLQELFNEMITTNKRYISPSKELVYLSFLPLSQLVTFEEAWKETTISDTEMLEYPVTVANEETLTSDSEIFSHLDTTEASSKSVSADLIEMGSSLSDVAMIVESEAEVAPGNVTEDQPHAKIMKIGSDQIESAIEIGRQQDVTECIENVTFQIETALEPDLLEEDGEQTDLIKRMFSGRTKQTITPLETDKPPRVSFERFFSLIINVGDHPRDIYDALDNYFGENVVNLEEGKVKMSATISQTPEILQFHVQRVLFDRERLMAYKSLEVIPFGENIYLDRYLDTTDEDILSKRQEVFEWKTEISKLSEEKQALLVVDPDTKLSIIDSLNATSKYLQSKVIDHDELDIKQETIDALQHQLGIINIRLQSINTRIQNLQLKISEQFESYKKFGYSLFAVFIHRGEASYGHYWIYIKDPKRNIFRKYNDDSVTEVPASEVFNFAETNTATPYYMVFVKEELTDSYIEPLKRLIKC